MKNTKPQFLITFLCPQCGLDSAMTELDTFHCFYCEAKNINFIILKKQKLTPKVMAERLKLINERLMENLQGAFQVGKELGDEDADELIEIMAQAKRLKEGVKELGLEDK